MGDTRRSRILRPIEYQALFEAAKAEANQVRLETLLLTGMRYVEARRLHDRPEWFDGSFVYLPTEAVLKHERRQLQRWVRLNPRGREVIPRFLKGKNLPTWNGWAKDLENWAWIAGLDPVGLGPKCTRKTWESWLVATYPERATEIFLNQGHTALTATHHYLNMPFLPEDKAAMKPWTDGMY